MSKSDPYLVLYNSNGHGGKTTEVGRTEVAKNDLNPKWKTSLNVDFFFETKQEFFITIFDDDGGKGDNQNEVLVNCEFTLARVMSSRNHRCTIDLRTVKPGCAVTVVAEEATTIGRDTLHLQLAGKKLKNMDTFGKSDPYYFLRRVYPNGQKVELAKSKTINDTLDPIWDPIKLTVDQMTGANLDEQCLELEVFDEDNFSSDLLGIVRFSFNELRNSASNPHKDEFVDAVGGASGERMPLVLLPELGKKGNHGYIHAAKFDLEHLMTFGEHLAAGLQINLAISIDFTGSNGDPRQSSSLHYMDPVSPNQYVRAIMSVGDILLQYDSDKMVAAFGFGARLPDGNISHYFNLSLDPSRAFLPGIQGVLDEYGKCLTQVRLSGPTNFAPSINAIVQGARAQRGVYTVHLILTDGEITDMPQTIDAIVAASDAPVSIVIVGVGHECGFEAMDQLDGDNGALRDSRGNTSRRDLVQFVPFRKFVNAPPDALAAEVLREIPRQVERWAQLSGISIHHQ